MYIIYTTLNPLYHEQNTLFIEDDSVVNIKEVVSRDFPQCGVRTPHRIVTIVFAKLNPSPKDVWPVNQGDQMHGVIHEKMYNNPMILPL